MSVCPLFLVRQSGPQRRKPVIFYFIMYGLKPVPFNCEARYPSERVFTQPLKRVPFRIRSSRRLYTQSMDASP